MAQSSASFNVGDEVGIHLNLDLFQELQSTVEIGWQTGMDKCIGQVGTVVAEYPSYVEVKFRCGQWKINTNALSKVETTPDNLVLPSILPSVNSVMFFGAIQAGLIAGQLIGRAAFFLESGIKYLAQPSNSGSEMDYELKSKNTKIGRALIIINENFSGLLVKDRRGADEDSKNLKKMFDLLQIEHTEHWDLNALKIREEIGKFATESSKDAPSVIFLVISSHGDHDNILGVDYSYPNKTDDLISVIDIQKLLNKNELKGVPKILILQACRGGEKQKLQKRAEFKDKTEPIEPVDFSVIFKDTLIIYPTSLDYVSWRSTSDGSWLITQLARCVEEYKDVVHFTDIVTICTSIIVRKYRSEQRETQTCTFKSSLTKFLNFRNIRKDALKKKIPEIEQICTYYELDEKRQGLIIINENFTFLNNRSIATLERKLLKDLFHQFGINFEYRQDLTAVEIEEEIDRFIKDFKTEGTSLLFIAICSHGGIGDQISGVNDKVPDSPERDFTTLRKIEGKFSVNPFLFGIPKVLLVQTCLGGEEKKTEFEADSAFRMRLCPSPRPYLVTSTSNTVIVCNTIDDRCCKGKINNMFLQTLNESMSENRGKYHFNEILTINAGKLSSDKTVCTFQSTLLKFLRI